MNVLDISHYGNNVALIDDYGEMLSYSGINDLINKIGQELSDQRKNILLILAGNNIETVVGYLAAIQSGNCVMLIDKDLDRDLVGELIQNYSPDFIWAPSPHSISSHSTFQYKSYSLVRQLQKSQQSHQEINRDLVLLLLTSGSTGSKKVVRLSARNLYANAYSIARYLELDHSDRPIAYLPIHYSYGLSVINSHLIVGATIQLTESTILSKKFWEYFTSIGCTSLAGVPYTFEMLKKIGFSAMELPTLRYMTQAGGPMTGGMVEEFAGVCRQKGIDLFIMYGATEATARMMYLSPKLVFEKPGSIGKAIPGGQVRLVDDAGNLIKQPFTSGELVYSGPNVMMGYALNREDLAKGDELAGELRTGDIGFFDEQGFFFINGRKSRFVKMLGKRIGLADIEAHLGALGWECVCGGSDNRLQIASHRDNHAENRVTVVDIRREVCKKFKLPGDMLEVMQINEFPRSSSGKIRYSDIFSVNTTSGG